MVLCDVQRIRFGMAEESKVPENSSIEKSSTTYLAKKKKTYFG